MIVAAYVLVSAGLVIGAIVLYDVLTVMLAPLFA